MSDHLNKKILLTGSGPMAMDYAKVLSELGCDFKVIGRGEASARKFTEATNIDVTTGGLSSFLRNRNENFNHAIVATGVEALAETTMQLLEAGVKRILVEKPGGLYREDIQSIVDKANEKKADVFIAYNRRFYASVEKALEIIREDGGVTSFNFEFTEWSHKIQDLQKGEGVKENWILANSTHVIDLAFFLGGKPEELCAYSAGKLSWHDKSIFAGAGISASGALFSYQANWEAPGRWAVEVLTRKHRLYLKPMETLQIQVLNSVAVQPVTIDDAIDKEFKPGLFRQVEDFLAGNNEKFCSIEEQAEAFGVFERIRTGIN